MTLLRYELFMATEDEGGGRTAFLGANYMNWLLYKLRPFNSWSEDERIRAAIDVLVGLADDGLSEFWDRAVRRPSGQLGARGKHPLYVVALRDRLERLVPIWWNDEKNEQVDDFDWELTPAGEELISRWYEEPPSVVKNRQALIRGPIQIMRDRRRWRHRNEGG